MHTWLLTKSTVSTPTIQYEYKNEWNAMSKVGGKSTTTTKITAKEASRMGETGERGK